MTRIVSPGAGGLPEKRMYPMPFYWRHQSPEILRWEWLNWPYAARQRKFYESMTGRTQGSVWMDECLPETLNVALPLSMQEQHAADARAWSLPHIETETNYLAQPVAYQNYLLMHNNYRPANPYTGRAAVATDVDELYIAPRVTFDSCMFQILMNVPDISEKTANYTYWVGFEVNSMGGNQIMALEMDAAGGVFNVVCKNIGHHSSEYDYGGVCQADNNALVINNEGDWAEYFFVWDPPVFRIIQPDAGQTVAGTNPDMFELSISGVPRTSVIQPFIANESGVITSAAANQWLVGQWAIYPLYHQANVYDLRTRANPIAACDQFSHIFDTGGRGHILVYMESLGPTADCIIEWSGEGEDNVATRPEVRTWRRIDDDDYNQETDANGIVSVGLFNAGRFIRARFTDDMNTSCADTVRTLQTIACTANSTS